MTTGRPVRKTPPLLRRLWSGRYRWWFRAALVVLVIVIALLVDVALIAARLTHITVRPSVGAGETFVIVGSDSRADIPVGADPDAFGTTAQVPGQRADVILVVHRGEDGGSSTLSIPRDLVVTSSRYGMDRLALTLQDGPQALIDGLCEDLGIPTNHLVVVDFVGFVSVIDALGGITVDIPHPIRDRKAGLDLDRAGPQLLTGAQALSLVRSREPEQLIGGTWVATPDGSAQRTQWSGRIFQEVLAVARREAINPIVAQRLAWAGAGSVTADDDTGIVDLARLALTVSAPSVLPTAPVPGTPLALQSTEATFRALAAAGFDRTCRPA